MTCAHNIKIGTGAYGGGFPIPTKMIYLKRFQMLAVLALMGNANFSLQKHKLAVYSRQGRERRFGNFHFSCTKP